MPGKQKRTRDLATTAQGVLDAIDAPVTVLPGVVSDDREIVKVDWANVDARAMIPYPTELAPNDTEGEYRRVRMDHLVLGTIRYGQFALPTIAAGLGMALEDQLGYAIPTVEEWLKGNVDDFTERVRHAHNVFKGRLMFAIIDRADKPYVPREHFRDNIPLFGALNAFVPEHFKRGTTQVNINTGEQANELHKTLVVVGEQMAQERKALMEPQR